MRSTDYKLLAEVLVAHEYYENGIFRDLRVVPDAKTQTFLWNANLIFKPSDNGFSVFYPQSFDAGYVTDLVEFLGEYYLRFELHSSTHHFFNFTNTSLNDLVLHQFSNKPMEADESLHLTLEPNLHFTDALGYVDLHLDSFVESENIVARTYQINFSSRQTQLNYFIANTGEENAKLMKIEDAGGEPFEGPEKESMANGATVFRFSSGERLYPLKEQGENYCVLKKTNPENNNNEDPDDEEVLIEKLPSASPSSITNIKQLSASHEDVACSSIYIYL
ncbi:MAG: hypothetical protein HEP71_04425 [Roseivirga sp.]|nr:hypothetical protein [Roseivirga sp.]